MPVARRHFFTAARWTWRLAIGGAAAILLGVVVLIVWARQIAAADSGARFALDSDDAVSVSRTDWIVFRPGDADPTVGVIFYPGGKAEPVAYAPILRELAAQGYLVVLMPMPLNLALLAPDSADAVPARFPEIRRWVIAGHSLGGVLACEYADSHPARVSGLVLWASYPGSFSDISQRDLPVLSISASADDLTTPAKIAGSRHRLPPSAHLLTIEGGDHWQFGNFAQHGSATIDRDAQQAAILAATGEFLASIAHTSEGESNESSPAPRSPMGGSVREKPPSL